VGHRFWLAAGWLVVLVNQLVDGSVTRWSTFSDFPSRSFVNQLVDGWPPAARIFLTGHSLGWLVIHSIWLVGCRLVGCRLVGSVRSDIFFSRLVGSIGYIFFPFVVLIFFKKIYKNTTRLYIFGFFRKKWTFLYIDP
jgi:hypothetical protein